MRLLCIDTRPHHVHDDCDKFCKEGIVYNGVLNTGYCTICKDKHDVYTLTPEIHILTSHFIPLQDEEIEQKETKKFEYETF